MLLFSALNKQTIEYLLISCLKFEFERCELRAMQAAFIKLYIKPTSYLNETVCNILPIWTQWEARSTIARNINWNCLDSLQAAPVSWFFCLSSALNFSPEWLLSVHLQVWLGQVKLFDTAD